MSVNTSRNSRSDVDSGQYPSWITMRNSITPTLLQTSSLLNTVVTLFSSPSIPLQTTEWTPQLRWHNRNWNGQPSRSSAGLRMNCIARLLIQQSTLPPINTTLSTHTGVVVSGVVGDHQVWEMQIDTSLNLSTNKSSTAKHEEEPFLHFDLNTELSFEDKSPLFNSLVALVKAGYTFDNTLQDRAVVFLKSFRPNWNECDLATNLVSNLVPSSDDSPTGFVDSPFHRPTLEFVLASPIVMAFSSCLSLVKNNFVKARVLSTINSLLQEWKKEGPEVAQSGKRVMQALFSEGIEDIVEQRMGCIA
ncbi:hypothetical protein BLNAU_4914 [Blattamonas nauphoetae]|uniref:Uncharacterized protein n=1 Tax=Blattamonas nauphoetae TaxID=2049346 RepID=A0ABQ9Y8F9_9EUKA|nr:hypothetical protein BLNAU_4914 [Blattamonas nauphoetae]